MWEKLFVTAVDDMKWLKNCIDSNHISLNLILALSHWKACTVNKMARPCKPTFIKHFHNNTRSETEGWNGKFPLALILMTRCIKAVHMNCGTDNSDSH